jgi:hypothetical protein
MNQISKVWRFLRVFLFSRANKEFLTFLFFLVLSGAFWLSLTLNETYEQEFSIPFAITDIPRNAVLTSDEVDTVKMTIRDKGIFLFAYHYGDYLKRINAHFRNYMRNNGTGYVSAQEMQKLVYQRLLSSSKIISVKPEKLEFYYNYGAKKQVPVRWSGRVIPEELYFISRVDYSPDSVTVYASEDKLDSINVVYTEALNYANFRDTLNVNCNLAKIKGVKMVPDHVKISFLTDVLTEERIEGIPIEGINMPAGKILRTFPARVAVSFVTGVSIYRNLTPQDFTVVADYNDIKRNPTEKCRIMLKNVPHGISRAKLEINFVDYLIESESE